MTCDGSACSSVNIVAFIVCRVGRACELGMDFVVYLFYLIKLLVAAGRFESYFPLTLTRSPHCMTILNVAKLIQQGIVDITRIVLRYTRARWKVLGLAHN